MRANRKYLFAVALLAVLAVVFGLAGTVAPVPESVSPQQSPSPSSVAHFQNPPTYDSGWVRTTDKLGQSFTLTHDLGTREALVDVVGRRSLTGEDHKLFFGSTFYEKGFNRTYGEAGGHFGHSVVETSDGAYALAGKGNNDFWLAKTDWAGNIVWNQTYGGAGGETATSVVQTFDGGYAIAGITDSFGAGHFDFWLVKTDAYGTKQWNQTYGGTSLDNCFSVIQAGDGGYALIGYTDSYDAGSWDAWLIKTDVEVGFSVGLSMTEFTNSTITLYRGSTDRYWNYVRVRIWIIKEPTWQYGDINQDGVVDAQDLFILSQNYGKTFSLLSLSGIVAVACIHTYKKRKQPK